MTASCDAAAASTVTFAVPVSVPVTVSVATTVFAPVVFSVVVKLFVPLSPARKVEFGGSTAWPSLLVKWTVPV